jgi:hypothetical protein
VAALAGLIEVAERCEGGSLACGDRVQPTPTPGRMMILSAGCYDSVGRLRQATLKVPMALSVGPVVW